MLTPWRCTSCTTISPASTKVSALPRQWPLVLRVGCGASRISWICWTRQRKRRSGRRLIGSVRRRLEFQKGALPNLANWLGSPFTYARINETTWMPEERRISLRHVLTAEALRLLEKNSRLDRILWDTVVAERICGVPQAQLADETFRQTIHRHEQIMNLKSESEHDNLRAADIRSPTRPQSCA